MKTLYSYASNVYSQNGEDGILAEILKRLAITTGWFVEFGAWDGKRASNTFLLATKGWSGVYIEGDPERFRELENNVKSLPAEIICINSWVDLHNLNCLLSNTPLKQTFELLSIDIDSDDYFVWQSLKVYQPIVVVIEINSSFPVGVFRSHDPAEKNPAKVGSSFSLMLELGAAKDYTLVCHTGNMIFIRNDYVSKLNLPQDELENPDKLFIDKWVPK